MGPPRRRVILVTGLLAAFLLLAAVGLVSGYFLASEPGILLASSDAASPQPVPSWILVLGVLLGTASAAALAALFSAARRSPPADVDAGTRQPSRLVVAVFVLALATAFVGSEALVSFAAVESELRWIPLAAGAGLGVMGIVLGLGGQVR